MAEQAEAVEQEEVEQQETEAVDTGQEQETEVEQQDTTEVEAEPAPKGGRANEAVRAARERAQAAERQAQEFQAELNRVRAERQAAEDAARRKAQEDDENLPYEQRLYNFTRRDAEERRRDLAQTQAQMQDSLDRSAFELSAKSDPLYQKYAGRVEDELKKMRAGGSNAPREAILTFLVGQDARSPKAKASAAKQKEAAANRVKDARGQPVNARSDAAKGSGGKSRLSDLEGRLDGVPL